MSNWTTEQRSAEEQRRRRAFQEDVPEHWCPECTSLTYEHEEGCFRCGSARPDEGWPRVDESGDSWLGRVLCERYLITRHIAHGAKARIYEADSRIIPRSFAIKLMDVAGGPDLDQPGLRKRLRREIEALSSLRNPHIMGFYDVFDVGDRHMGFVMDLIQGISLDELVNREGSLSSRRAMRIVRQLANGVYEAHQRDLVHRDLKPSNVMIETLPAGDDFVRILDFGVVWVRGTVSDTGAFDEAPVFSSPEQITLGSVDHRADIYSLGALAFFMLTGQPPFSRSAVMGNLDVLLNDPPPTLEDVSGRSFPAAIEALVATLLAKDPDDRPNEAAEVMDWLDEIDSQTMELELELDSASEVVDEGAEDFAPAPTATAMGMIPTLGELSSPVLKLEPSEMSHVSEASVEAPRAMACRGGGYAFLLGDQVIWSGDFDTVEPGTIDPDLNIDSMAVTESLVLLGTTDGKLLKVEPGAAAEVMFQDPRQARMTAVAMIPAATTMMAGSESGRLYVSRGTDWVRMGTGSEHVSALAINEDGSQFAVARGKNIQVMSVSASNLSSFPSPVDEVVIAMAFSDDDYLIAVLTETGKVVLESVHTGQEFMRLDTANPDLREVTFSPDNHLMGLFVEADRVVLRKLT